MLALFVVYVYGRAVYNEKNNKKESPGRMVFQSNLFTMYA